MKCPICEKPTEWKENPNRPFCSERCKLIDFGGWVNGEYAVPSDEPVVPGNEMSPEADAAREADTAD